MTNARLPLASELAFAAPEWGRAVGRVAEDVTRLLEALWEVCQPKPDIGHWQEPRGGVPIRRAIGAWGRRGAGDSRTTLLLVRVARFRQEADV